MRTFWITLAVVAAIITWWLNKPIPKKSHPDRVFSELEIGYLEKAFNYAMDNVKEGEFSDWSLPAANGRIAAGSIFTSNRNATCRNYLEISRTRESQKADSGVACKRNGKEGWCRVRGDNPQSCALEEPESLLVKQARTAIMRGQHGLDGISMPHSNFDSRKLIPHAPDIDPPALGPIDLPSLPDIEPADLRPPMPWDPGERQ